MNYLLHNSLLKNCQSLLWKAILTCTTLKPLKNGHSLPRETTKYGLRNKPLEEASMQLSQRDNQTLIWKDNSIGNEKTKEEGRDRGKPTAAKTKANGVEVIQDSLDPLIQMPWTQVLLHEKSTPRKKNSIIRRKDDALNAQKLGILHDSVQTENLMSKL